MQCPNCNRMNPYSSRYCQYCHTDLKASAGNEGEKSGKETTDLSAIQSEIKQIRSILSSLDNRLNNLEEQIQKQNLSGNIVPEARKTSDIQQKTQEPVPVKKTSDEQISSKTNTTFSEKYVAKAQSGAQVPFSASHPSVSPPHQNREWEQILGGNWLARIGVLALIIGVAFFLKFAFDKNWLGPTARVLLGIGAGLVLLMLGYFWNKKYPIFAQALSGGGVALLYVCIFAAFAVFNLIGFYLAIVFLVIISGISTLLAVRYNSMAMAIIGIIGAFSAPFVLGVSQNDINTSISGGNGNQLMIYIFLVDIGVLILSTFRNWRWFNLLAFVASAGCYAIWYNRFGWSASLLNAELNLTILFLIFFGATILYGFVRKSQAEVFDYALMSLNAAVYFGVSQTLMWDELRVWMGGFSILVAMLYGGLAFYAIKKNARQLGFFALGICLIFLTIAIPVQIGNKGWTTIAWAAEGTIAIWLSLKLQINIFRYSGILAFILMIIRLVSFDTYIAGKYFVPVLNERVLAFLFGITATYLAGYLLWHKKQPGFQIFFSISNLLAFWVAAAETIQYLYNYSPNSSGTFTMCFLMVIAAWLAFQVILTQRTAEKSDRFFWIINPAVFLLFNILLWDEFGNWIGFIFLIWSAIYGFQIYFLHRNKYIAFESSEGLIFLGVPITFLTLLSYAQFGTQAWTTITWAVEMVILTLFSFIWKIPQLRVYSAVLFVLMAGKLIFFDTFEVIHHRIRVGAYTPFFNERVMAFVLCIALIYLGVYIILRFRSQFPDWETPVSTVLIAASLFTVWLISFEVWNYFDLQLAALGTKSVHNESIIALHSAQKFSLTVVWTLYSVIVLIVGIKRRLRTARLGALCLLAIAIIKVFVYDVFVLEPLYRIIAFSGLGILLIISGYLYHRYSRIIKDFLVNKEDNPLH